MQIAVLGTGMVGRAHAERLAALGHEVRLGTQDVGATSGRAVDEGGPTFEQWCDRFPGLALAGQADAVVGADVVINALNGAVAVEALAALADRIGDTVLIDLTNPLDFSTGRLLLTVCNTDSVGEQLQRALPGARVVKAFSHVTAAVQVDPGVLPGPQHFFLAGDDPAAKETTVALARGYGWRDVVDLGDISGSRGLEMMLPMWLNLMNALGTARFGYRVVTDAPG